MPSRSQFLSEAALNLQHHQRCLERCSWILKRIYRILERIYIWGRWHYFSQTDHLDGQHSHQSREVTLRSNT